jgi:hypothetical protein
LAYILDVLNKVIEPQPSRISLETYLVEHSYITKYLSRIVKDKALVVYQVLFWLTYFETGKGEFVLPWAAIGAYIRSEQGNIIDNATTVKRRLGDLLRNQCIVVTRQRGNANHIFVNLPSSISVCRELIEKEQFSENKEQVSSNIDFYTDPVRRLQILSRDNFKCVYCLADLSENSFVLDHLISLSRGGPNYEHNLVTCCESCNGRKQDKEAIEFLLENYRARLLSQEEYMKVKDKIEEMIEKTL